MSFPWVIFGFILYQLSVAAVDGARTCDRSGSVEVDALVLSGIIATGAIAISRLLS